jgi:hypothetical protein
VQIIKRDEEQGGVLKLGTEVVLCRRHHRRPAGRIARRVDRCTDHADRAAESLQGQGRYPGLAGKAAPDRAKLRH